VPTCLQLWLREAAISCMVLVRNGEILHAIYEKWT